MVAWVTRTHSYAMQLTRPAPLTLTIRELLRNWDAQRRGAWVVERIQQDLRRHGLAIVPSFIDGWIDTKVTLLPMSQRTGPGTETSIVGGAEQDRSDDHEVGLRIGSLESAASGLKWVAGSESLTRATSIMMRHDYSQLAAMNGPHNLIGAISWDSIAQTQMRMSSPALGDAVIPAQEASIDDDLLAQIPVTPRPATSSCGRSTGSIVVS